MSEEQARLEGVRQYFPQCEAVTCDVQRDGETDITVYVNLGFRKADPRLIARPTCSALCAHIRQEIRDDIASLAGWKLARSMNIRVQLAFFELGADDANPAA